MTPAFAPRTPVGLIAGAGRFPILFAEKARASGIPVICVGIAGMADPVLREICPQFRWLRRMSIGFCIDSFKRGGATRFTLAGKLHKHLLMRPWRWLSLVPDYRALRLWYVRQKSDRRDDSLLLALIAEFRGEGLECASALELVPELLVKPGVPTRRKPTATEELDIKFGWALAKEMGRLDIGQSVMVRESAVLAVEAIEGTDRAIARAGELCGRNRFVVVKVAKPKQDMRFDVPTVGTTTIEVMRQAGATLLAIEAGRTIFLDEAETIALADKYNIAIAAIDAPV